MISLRRIANGDTIVEVLLAMAVLGFILGGAYVTANRALLTDEDTQERSQAITLAQSQIEDLYQAAAAGKLSQSAYNFGVTNDCFDGTTGSPSGMCFVPNSNTSLNIFPCNSSYAFCYQVQITKSPGTGTMNPASPIPLNTYTITVTWLRLGSSSKDSVQLYYQPG